MMVEVQFRKPNFRAKVREKSRPQANPKFRLLYAEDEQSARHFLEQSKLDVLDLKRYDFNRWLQKAKKARETALTDYPLARQTGKSYEFNSELWGQLKEHLQDLFQGRCAYCEAWFQQVSFGDVEHYRPKAEVTDDPQHPGYYWLAYDETNYLPSCSVCNTKGKGNHFPIKGTRVNNPTLGLDQEQPLLINPYLDKHCDHIGYLPAVCTNHPTLVAGMAFERTERGKCSIECYDLNRDPMVRARARAQQRVVERVQIEIIKRNKAAVDEIRRNCLDGKEEYCTAAATEIDAFYKQMGFGQAFPSEIKLGL